VLVLLVLLVLADACAPDMQLSRPNSSFRPAEHLVYQVTMLAATW
jgi:hypothetical protein